MGKRPASVDLASWLLWVLVVAGLVVSVLVVVLREDLEEAWSPGRTGDSTVQPLEFVPVILVLYGVIAVTTLTLIPMMRAGENWARHALALIAVGILLATLATVRTMPPPLFRGMIIAAAVISAVSLVFLWHPDTRRHCRAAAELDAADARPQP
ncbi:hypothetical protein [Nocardioides pelophilus]|uniref:hypothetical protein n=1 Tax=Nocardioides pelophilus TaxID=2172019 RepID=UPI001602BFFE|nr:hypothetical protein [Nocardioides pelophilus]